MNILAGLMLLIQVLLDFYLRFSSPFIALSLLSLTIFITMLPLYTLGDWLLAQEKQRKSKVQPELDSIAGLPSGNRKYFYTKEIYRRHGYSPLYALTGLFGLAVQVPFFFAAYRVLHDFQPFAGFTVGPFHLSKPDALLRFSGLSINLLPIIMTLTNVLSSYYHAESTEEKRKIWFFPTLFLLLLYQEPVALVFYWSMNNLFSLIKNICHRRTFAISECTWGKLRRILSSDIALGAHLGLCCFAVIFALLYFLYTDSDNNIPSLWINTALILLFYLGLYYFCLSNRYYVNNVGVELINLQQFGKTANLLVLARWLQIICLLGSLILQFGLLCLAWLSAQSVLQFELQQILKFRQTVQTLRPVALLLEFSAVVLGLLLFGYKNALLWPEVHNKLLKKSRRKSTKYQKLQSNNLRRYFLAVMSILIAIFWVVPARVFSSDPETFEGNTNLASLVASLFLFFLIVLLFFSILYFILPFSAKFYSSYLATIGAWFLNINVFLLPGHYGAMEFTSFKKPLEISNNTIAASALLLALLFLILPALYLSWQKSAVLEKVKRLDQALIFFLVLHGISIITSFYKIIQYQMQTQNIAKEKLAKEAKGESEKTVETNQNLIQLSQNGQNAIILVLDKFIGSMVPEILNANPTLAKMLDGFTYYPNTVSQSNQTYGGFHPIVGGSEYTIEKMNENERSLATDIVEALTMIPKALSQKSQAQNQENQAQAQQFNFYFVNVKYLIMPRARGALQERFASLKIKELETSLDYSLLPNPKQVRSNAGGKLKWQNFLAMLGVFQVFGPIFREKIYDDGRWLNTLGSTDLWASIAFWEPYIQLLGLLQWFEPDNSLDGAYVLIHNHLPHNTTFHDSYSYFANQKNFAFPLSKIPNALQQEDTKNGNKRLATLFLANYQTLYLIAQWLETLKQQRLYDNTIIYLVSDHGERIKQRSAKMPYQSAWHSLYMHKGLNARGQLKISNEFRTVADIPAEFLPEFGVSYNPYSGRKLEPVRSEPIPLYDIVSNLARNEQKAGNDRKYFINGLYYLHNRNIFDNANWQKQK